MESFFNIIPKTVQSSTPPKLCILLDIDETMLQYVDQPIGRDYDWFNNVTIQLRETGVANPKVVFRPYLDLFFKYAVKNGIHLGIWTYGSRTHAELTAKQWIPFFIDNIEKQSGTKISPALTFDFVYCDDDYSKWKEKTGESHDKDLRMIYQNHKHWTPENTLIIDNSIFNVSHIHNAKNGILIQPFQPSARDFHSYEDAKSDAVFLDDIIPICHKLLERPSDKSISDILEPYQYSLSKDIVVFIVGKKIHDHRGEYVFIKRTDPSFFERAKKKGNKPTKYSIRNV